MSIYTEVRKLISDRLAADQMVAVDQITYEIVSQHELVIGSDRDFFLGCAHAQVKEVVKKCVAKYDSPRARADDQLVLRGYERLQVAYSIDRGNGPVLVPITLMTDAELEGRASEFVGMIDGLRVHIREIREFIASRVHVREGRAS